jgi:hypothetical protein
MHSAVRDRNMCACAKDLQRERITGETERTSVTFYRLVLQNINVLDLFMARIFERGGRMDRRVGRKVDMLFGGLWVVRQLDVWMYR